MMSKPTYTTGPSSQPSFIESPHIEIPPHQAPHAPKHAPWMDLSTKISYLGTHMEELVVVGDTWFYSMEDRMDQYQASFTYQFEISSRGLSILRIAWINIKLASPHSLSISSRGLSILKISWISIRLASPHSLSISNSGLSVLRIAWRVSMRR